MKANYKAFQEIDHKNTRLEAKLTTNAKRVALKDALGMAHKRGQRLDENPEKDPAKEYDWYQKAIEEWVWNTHGLKEAALGQGEAQRFLSNEGYYFGKVDGVREFMLRGNTYLIGPRLWRLEELIGRVDSLLMRPNFDPQERTQKPPED
jgi:hypothetical protein